MQRRNLQAVEWLVLVRIDVGGGSSDTPCSFGFTVTRAENELKRAPR